MIVQTDGTQKYLKKLKKLKHFKFIFKDKNMGKGHSQKFVEKLQKVILVIHDADLEYGLMI